MKKYKLINSMILAAILSGTALADELLSKAIYDSRLKTLTLDGVLVQFIDEFSGQITDKKGIYNLQLEEVNKRLFKLNRQSIMLKKMFEGEDTSGYILYDRKTRSLTVPCFKVNTISTFNNGMKGESVYYKNVTLKQLHVTYPIFLVKNMTKTVSCNNYVISEPKKLVKKPRLITNPKLIHDNAVEIEINGTFGTTVFVNGVNSGKTIALNGKLKFLLDISRNKNFSIILKDNSGNESDPLVFNFTKQSTTPTITPITITIPTIIPNHTTVEIKVPTLTTTPTTTQNDSIKVVVNGKLGTTVFVNGVNSGKTIDATGKVQVTLNTSGSVGDKNFSITLKDSAGNNSQALTFTISKSLENVPENETVTTNDFEFLFLSHYSSGDEVWKINNDKEPELVKALNKEGKDGNYIDYNLLKFGNYYYFLAYNPLYGKELWRTDGTEAGTSMIKDIVTGKDSSNITDLTVVNDTLYFAADYDGENGRELWKTDGTESNTVMVKDIFEGKRSSNPDNLINLNGTLLFRANNGFLGHELWRSDGTVSGTYMVKDIYRGTSSSSHHQVVFNKNKQIIYFIANDGPHGYELWRSDGTTSGTNMVKDISSNITELINIGDILYFKHHSYLWKSNGIASGTVQIRTSSGLNHLSNINGTLYFSAYIDGNHTELWKSDGTPETTKMVADINVSGHSNPRYMTNLNGLVYFRATDGVYGDELWKTDGKTTIRVTDLIPDAGGANITDIKNIKGNLYFKADDGSGNRNQLWMSDGTKEGTKQIFHKY